MEIGTFPGVMELHVLRIIVFVGEGRWKGGFTKAISTVDFKLALSDFNKSKSHLGVPVICDFTITESFLAY